MALRAGERGLLAGLARRPAPRGGRADRLAERRGALRAGRATLKHALAVAGLLAVSVAEACEIPLDFPALGRAESEGVVVAFRTVPDPIEVGRHFAVEARVCADGEAPVLTRVDAAMPRHRHGMNYRPSLSSAPDRGYRAEGLLFHMPGLWRLVFDVERAGRRTRLTADLLVE